MYTTYVTAEKKLLKVLVPRQIAFIVEKYVIVKLFCFLRTLLFVTFRTRPPEHTHEIRLFPGESTPPLRPG